MKTKQAVKVQKPTGLAIKTFFKNVGEFDTTIIKIRPDIVHVEMPNRNLLNRCLRATGFVATETTRGSGMVFITYRHPKIKGACLIVVGESGNKKAHIELYRNAFWLSAEWRNINCN